MSASNWPQQWLIPQDLPPGVGAVMTTRAAGHSAGPYQAMNLGLRVGDEPEMVRRNRADLALAIGARPLYLHQVHGKQVQPWGIEQAAACLDDHVQADASFTVEPGWACLVQTADCLPVLLAARDAAGRVRGVAAAHAGWRGLSAGVLEAAVHDLCAACASAPHDCWAWIGPGIGAQRFEVGVDVLQAFGCDPARPGPQFRAVDASHWLADLAGLARDRLLAVGLRDIGGGRWCTVSDDRFYSFRRDRVTGRMAACIWLQG